MVDGVEDNGWRWSGSPSWTGWHDWGSASGGSSSDGDGDDVDEKADDGDGGDGDSLEMLEKQFDVKGVLLALGKQFERFERLFVSF